MARVSHLRSDTARAVAVLGAAAAAAIAIVRARSNGVTVALEVVAVVGGTPAAVATSLDCGAAQKRSVRTAGTAEIAANATVRRRTHSRKIAGTGAMRTSTIAAAGAPAGIANKRITCYGVTTADRALTVPARWGSSILDVGLC